MTRLDLCGRPVPAEEIYEQCSVCKLEVPFTLSDGRCVECSPKGSRFIATGTWQ